MPSDPSFGRQLVATAVFSVLAVLTFYVVVATIGLETGPLHPDVMMGILFVALAIAAAVFVYVVPFPYPLYAVTLLLTGFFVEGVRRYVLSGFDGVEYPVITPITLVIIAALLVGGALTAGSRRAYRVLDGYRNPQ